VEAALNGSVVVTGGFGVLGRCVAAQAAAAGASVALIDRAPQAPQDLPAFMCALPGVDLSRSDDAGRAVGNAAEHFGRIDGLANIAGEVSGRL
jgi:NAD(P)-dependent dehydrogenase (short-subunit alcohol dehydrogenase family)